MVRKHFYHLFHTANPPYKIVKHFAHLLNFNLEDYYRELELQVGYDYYYFLNICINFYIVIYYRIFEVKLRNLYVRAIKCHMKLMSWI